MRESQPRLEIDPETYRLVRVGSELLSVTKKLYVRSAVYVFYRDTAPDAIKRNDELLKEARDLVPGPDAIKELERSLGIVFPEDPNIED
ncbi:MAG TPA: hypothetical protein VLF88_00390 [Candidatus Babeliales bacterium]|nr:hypothetical protein [Candidatus Babeliales bacterium]